MTGRIHQKLTKAQGWARGGIAATLALTLAFAVLPMASAEEPVPPDETVVVTDDAKKAQEAEDAKKAQEAEDAKKAQEAEDAKKAQEAEDAKKAQEAEDAKKAQEAEDAKKAQEAEDAKKAQEAEDAKKAQEAEDAKKAQEAEETDGSDLTGDGTAARIAPASVPSELTDLEPAYLRWRAINADDPDGDPVAETTWEVKGATDSDPNAKVEDNIGQADYEGVDLDPKPGEFLVQQLVDDDDAVIDVEGDKAYELRPSNAPAGFLTGDDTDWQKLESVSSADDEAEDLYLSAPSMSPFLIVGEPDGAAPPYVYWEVVDTNGDPVGGASFTLQGPRTGGGGGGGTWNNNSTTVTDCTAEPCSGPDLDSDPGEFLVKNIDTHAIVATNRYRIQQAAPPTGYRFTAATNWVNGSGSGNTPSGWVDSTYDFGSFQVAEEGNYTPQCTAGYVYAITAQGQIRQVAPNGTVTSFGTAASGVSSFNGIGIGSGGSSVFGYERTNSSQTATVWRFDTATGTWATTSQTVNSETNDRTVTFVAGAVDLYTGNYYFGGYGSGGTVFRIWKYVPSANTISYAGYIDTSTEAGGATNGDMAFNAAGDAFVVRGSGDETTIFSITQANLASASGGLITSSYSNKVTTSNNINGVAFDSAGNGFLGQGQILTRYDMPAWTNAAQVTNGLGVSTNNTSTDLASCSSPPVITVEKVVEGGRVNTGDQFTLTLNQGQTQLATTTTTGSATGVQSQRIGPLPTVPGAQLTFAETASGTTNLSQYASVYRCTVDGEQTTQGTGTSGTITVPIGAQVIECQFVNSPLVATVNIHKTVTDANGANPANGVDWTVGAAAVAAQGSTVTKSPTDATLTTNSSGNASWSLTFGAANHSATVSVHEVMKDGYAFQSGTCTVTHLDGTETDVTLTGAAATELSGIVPGDSVSCAYTNREQLDDLTVTKTANTEYAVNYTWDIEKNVVGDDSVKVPSTTDEVDFDYQVVVTPSGPIRSGFKVTGNITVTNPNNVAFTGVNIADSLALTGANCTVTNGSSVTVPANDSVTRAYECTLPNTTSISASGLNTATATWTAASYPGTSGSASGTATANFSNATVTTTNDTVTLTDSEYDFPGAPVVLNASGGVKTFDYTLTWPTTAGTCESYENTATIANDQDVDESDDAEVEVCAGLDLTVEKVAVNSLTRTYDWSITKDVDATRRSVGADGTATFDYTVTVTPQPYTDKDWAMSGTITVANPNDWDVTGVEVTDTPGFAGATCTVTDGTNATVAANSSSVFDYVCTFSSEPNLTGTNTATITWDAEDAGTPTGTDSDTVDIAGDDWSMATYNHNITVVDDQTDPANPVTLGTTDWTTVTNDPTEGVFSYSLPLDGPAQAGECVSYTNTAVISGLGKQDQETVEVCAPEGEVVKSVVSTTQNDDFSWTIVYDIVVTNPSTTDDLVYDLTDSFDFGTGVTVVSAGLTSGPAGVTVNPNWDGDSDDVIATDVALPANDEGNASHTYRISVRVNVDGEAEGANLECTTGQTGGFRNTTAIEYPGGSDEAEACSTPESPTVTKVGKTAIQDPVTGNWTVTYDVVVTNPSETQQLAYEATDTAAALPSSLSQVTGWTISGPAETTGTSELVDPAWSGSGTFATGTLPAGTSHTYTVTGVVAVTGAVTPGDLTCTPNNTGGLINSATVTNGVGSDDDDACVDITPGAVTVAKSDGTVTQLDDFSWQIDYTVTVNNASGVTTTYTLTDTPDLGDGFDLTSGAWVGTAPVADTVIADGDTDTYTYRVIATFDPEVEDPELTCDPSDGGAFFNTATVTFPAGTDSDTGCAEPASPTVTKTGPATATFVNGAWQLTYTVTVTNGSTMQLAYEASDTAPSTPTGVTLADGWAVTGPTALNGGTAELADPAWDGSGVFATGTLPAGASHVYTVTASVTLDNDVDLESLECTPNEPDNGFLNAASVSNGVGGDSDEHCITIEPPALTIEKSDATVSQGVDGVWTLIYAITVTNGTDIDASYELTDAPNFDSFFTVVPVAEPWSTDGTEDTAQAGNPSGTVDANSSVVWYYTVQATTDGDDPAPESALMCMEDGDEDGGGGFHNRATVSFPGGSATDDGCGEPDSPLVEKIGQAAVQNADGTWTLTYQVVVSNTSDIQLAYEASDTAAALPTGVSGGAWAATGPVKSPADAGEATRNTSWSGTGVLATGVLPAGATHTYTVSRTVNVAATTPGSALVCGQTPGQGGGVWNSATVTNGVGGNTDQDCISIVRPDVFIAKEVTSTRQLSDGTWQIVYEVRATNASSTLVAVYSLTDTLEFGGDIVVNSASWTGPASSSGTFTGDSATLATDRVLAAAGIHTYVVTVNATVDADAWDGDTLTCDSGEGAPDAGGFLNTVLLTVNGGTKPADDCSEPSLPGLTKTPLGAVQDPDDASLWLVSYTLTVTAGEHDTFYDLSDTPGFASGITLGDGTAQRTDIDGEPVIDIQSGVNFVNGQDLLAGETHTYVITWLADLSSSFDPTEAGQCSAEPSEGEGFFNSATLTVGDVDIDDDTCIPVDERVYPTVTKTVTSTSQGIDGKWTIVYDVEVNLTDDEVLNPKGLSAEYDLTDTLDFGGEINISSATWSGESSGTFSGETATLATDKTIAAGATHTYTVTAIAEITPAAVEQETLGCQVSEGQPLAGGFLNTVLLTSGGQESTDFDCSEPDSPLVEKNGQTAVQNADGTWTLTYELVVTNPSADQQLGYTLTDTPAALPTGVTLVGAWSADGPDVTGGGSGDLTDGWNGDDQTEVATGVLPVGVVHTYTVTATVKVAASVPDSALNECSVTEVGTTGVWNSTTVTNGAGTDDDDDCIPVIRQGDVDIAKTVTNVAQLADGTWQITYDVVASNGTEYVGVYSLTDTVAFGGDIVVNSASWSGQSSGTFAGDTATLATDVALGAGESHTYVVTVNATVDAEAWAGETLECQAGEGGSSGGFLNTAELTVNGNPKEAEDCAEPSLPLIQKTGAGAVQDPTDASKWLVSYNIKVTGGEHDTFYDLSDEPGFAAGITLGDGTAQRTDIGGQPVVPITSGAKFANDVPLAAGAVHTYVVTWIADVTDAFDPSSVDLQCTDDPQRGQAFYNAVRLSVGDVNLDDDTCIPVLQRVYPTVTKTATSTTQGSNSNWTIVYDVVVNLPANELGLAAEYDLTDTLDFGDGITVIGATWTGPDGASGTFSGDSAVLATDKTIASGGTHTFTVTVVAAVSTASFEEETYQCVIGESGPEAGGFLNTVLLTSGGQSSTDFDCTEPELPTEELPEEENPTDELPYTGSNPGWLIGGALLAVLAGSGLLLIGRRRREGNATR